RCFVLLLLSIALFYPGTVADAQSPTARLRVAPSTLTLGVGERVDIVVEVVDVQALYAFDVQLSFDPAVIEVIDADPALPETQISFGTFLDTGLVARNRVDPNEGTIHFAMTQLRPSE